MIRFISRSFTFSSKKFAIVLSGCGVYDGSEIHEATAMLIHLSRKRIGYKCFAPNRDQAHVIDHLTGKEMQQKRNAKQEAARIARGNIQDLLNLKASNFDALLIPGGFGAAKNLSDFAFKGAEMQVDLELTKILKDFYKAKKPIGLCCISPIIAARVFGTKFQGPGVNLTLGKTGKNWPFGESIECAQSFGNQLDLKDVDQISVDEKNKIVCTPAYMKETARPCDVYDGIGKMIDHILEL